MKRSKSTITTTLLAAALLAGSLFLGGCVIAIGDKPDATPCPPAEHVSRRVPADAQLVAYGKSMRFEAPKAGMAYFVDADSGELWHIAQLEKGEVIEAGPSGLEYGGNRYNDIDWSMAFDEHELYFLPTSWDEPPAEREEPIVIVIEDGTARLGGEEVELDDLPGRLEELAEAGAEREVRIRARNSTALSDATRVLDMVREAGFEQTAISVAE
ncbi:MAG: ExbD/TolR family protein [Phycisphaeraceae bacterium]